MSARRHHNKATAQLCCSHLAPSSHHGACLSWASEKPNRGREAEVRASGPGPAPSLTGTRKKCLQLAWGLVHTKLCLFAMEILVVTETDTIQAVSRKLLLWGGFLAPCLTYTPVNHGKVPNNRCGN